MHKDDVAWMQADQDDLWIFDKLLLARKMGYVCGPAGVDVPTPGNYIVRPCVNVMGMGLGAEIAWLEEETDDLPAGTFWCEVFEGPHLSVDYEFGRQVLCVQGVRSASAPLYRWDRWLKVGYEVSCPEFLRKVPYSNCEFIGGRVIEAHLRHNPDFALYETTELVPVWSGSNTTPPDGYRFVDDADFHRIGFFVKARQ